MILRQIAETALGQMQQRDIDIMDLQSDGPWWSGHFAKSWKVSTSPVKPTDSSRFKEERERKDQQLPSQFNDRANNNEVQCNSSEVVKHKEQRVEHGGSTYGLDFMDTVEYPGKMGRVPGLPSDIPAIGSKQSHIIYIGNEAIICWFCCKQA